VARGKVKVISEQFVQQFRQKRIDRDWDLWQLRQWMAEEEAKLKDDNPGLHDYIGGVLAGLSDTLDTRLCRPPIILRAQWQNSLRYE
jgi:outer membrane phospholipase A